MQTKFKTTVELEVTVLANVTPAVAPRPCNNPDDPAFSDPGDPGGCEIEAVFVRVPGTGKRIDITDALSDDQIDDLETQAEQEVTRD